MFWWGKENKGNINILTVVMRLKSDGQFCNQFFSKYTRKALSIIDDIWWTLSSPYFIHGLARTGWRDALISSGMLFDATSFLKTVGSLISRHHRGNDFCPLIGGVRLLESLKFFIFCGLGGGGYFKSFKFLLNSEV